MGGSEAIKNNAQYMMMVMILIMLALPLLAAPHPVAAQSGTELVPGAYRGWVFLYANLTTHQSANMGNANFDFNVRAKWKADGKVNIAVTGKDKVTASLKLEMFTVLNSDNNFYSGKWPDLQLVRRRAGEGEMDNLQ